MQRCVRMQSGSGLIYHAPAERTDYAYQPAVDAAASVTSIAVAPKAVKLVDDSMARARCPGALRAATGPCSGEQIQVPISKAANYDLLRMYAHTGIPARERIFGVLCLLLWVVGAH